MGSSWAIIPGTRSVARSFLQIAPITLPLYHHFCWLSHHVCWLSHHDITIQKGQLVESRVLSQFPFISSFGWMSNLLSPLVYHVPRCRAIGVAPGVSQSIDEVLLRPGSINRGTPIAGWFSSWKTLFKWIIWGYPHFRKSSYKWSHIC